MMKDSPRITIDFSIVEKYIRKDESVNRFLQHVASEKVKGYTVISIEDIEMALLTDYSCETKDDLADVDTGYMD